MKNLTLIFKNSFLLIALVASAACSQHNRETQWDPSFEELDAIVTSVFSDARSSGGNIALLNAAENSINNETQPGVFYLGVSFDENDQGTGVAASVASIRDFSILGMGSNGLYDVAEAKVLLVDNYLSENREFTLVVQVKFYTDSESTQTGNFQTRVFSTQQFEFTDKKLTLSFANFTLESFDLSDVEDDLAPVIQLKIYDNEGTSYGKFSSLLGFGG